MAIKLCTRGSRGQSEVSILSHLEGLGCAVRMLHGQPMLMVSSKEGDGTDDDFIQYCKGYMVVTEWQPCTGLLGDFTAGTAKELLQLCLHRALQLVHVQ